MTMLAWVFLVWAAAVTAQDAVVPTPFDYAFTARDRYLLAQARVHEAGWGTAVCDAGGILQVVMARRDEGASFEAALAETMPHFYAGVRDPRVVRRDVSVTRRLWVLELPNAPIRRDPAHWPYGYPARTHTDDWQDANEDAAAYMNGGRALPFADPVIRWFGRTTDGEQLEAALADGWCEAVPVGVDPTHNAFLFRCAEEPAAEGDGPSAAGASPGAGT
jgi:hypothetical protein